jgi:uncharacterized protein (TIGR02466 family)
LDNFQPSQVQNQYKLTFQSHFIQKNMIQESVYLLKTQRKILKNKELTELRDFIEDSMIEYFKAIHAPKFDVSLYLTQSWANYTEKGQHHHKHAHPNSVVSGVFYPQADRAVDKIYFYKDGYERIKVPAKEFNPYNSESWWFEAGTGILYLFPSSLTHMVEAVTAAETRISLSFNTFLKGNIGDNHSLTELKIEE